jgi:hypothetical protein
MTKKELIDKIDKLIQTHDGYGVQDLLSSDYDGACPCFWSDIELDDAKFKCHGRCWRVSENGQDLHYSGDKEIAEKVKEALDYQKWYQNYTLIKDDPTHPLTTKDKQT